VCDGVLSRVPPAPPPPLRARRARLHERGRLHGRGEWQRAPPLALWRGGWLEPDGAGLPGAPQGSAACPLLRRMRCRNVPAGELAVSITTGKTTAAEPASRCANSRARAAAAGRAHMLTMLPARRAQVAAGWSAEEFAAAAAAALDDGVAEPQTLQRVAAARGLPPPAACAPAYGPGRPAGGASLGSACGERGARRPAARWQNTLGCERPQGWADMSEAPIVVAVCHHHELPIWRSAAGWACWVGMLSWSWGFAHGSSVWVRAAEPALSCACCSLPSDLCYHSLVPSTQMRTHYPCPEAITC